MEGQRTVKYPMKIADQSATSMPWPTMPALTFNSIQTLYFSYMCVFSNGRN